MFSSFYCFQPNDVFFSTLNCSNFKVQRFWIQDTSLKKCSLKISTWNNFVLHMKPQITMANKQHDTPKKGDLSLTIKHQQVGRMSASKEGCLVRVLLLIISTIRSNSLTFCKLCPCCYANVFTFLRLCSRSKVSNLIYHLVCESHTSRKHMLLQTLVTA